MFMITLMVPFPSYSVEFGDNMWGQTGEQHGDNKTNLIINYLPQTYTDEEMYSLFSTVGKVVNCKIIRDKKSGYSYGFGFVEYGTAEEAQNAMDHLNGCEIENKRIKVALARPPGEDTKGANLYIRNIPINYDEETLKNQFISYGNIVQTRILQDRYTGQSKGVGFVLFEKKSDADKAMSEMNGQLPPGGTQRYHIKFADDNAKKVRPPPNQVGYGAPMGGFGNGGGYSTPRPGGPMRGPGGTGRMRYNPMGSAAGMGNGYSGGYATGYSGYGSTSRGRGASVSSNPVRGPSYNQFGAGDASSSDGVILFVYNIGIDATENDLWNLFSPYGTIKKVNVIWDHSQNKCKGYGFVTMSSMDEAKYAIEYLNGFYYKTAPLQVSIKNDKK
ncbi:hypothetical protein ACF0H5_021627 [Mactra antiquata]